MMYGQFSGIVEIPAAILGYLFAASIEYFTFLALSFDFNYSFHFFILHAN